MRVPLTLSFSIYLSIHLSVSLTHFSFSLSFSLSLSHTHIRTYTLYLSICLSLSLSLSFSLYISLLLSPLSSTCLFVLIWNFNVKIRCCWSWCCICAPKVRSWGSGGTGSSSRWRHRSTDKKMNKYNIENLSVNTFTSLYFILLYEEFALICCI